MRQLSTCINSWWEQQNALWMDNIFLFCVPCLIQAISFPGRQFPSSQETSMGNEMSVSLWEWGQVAVITVKEVSQKECRSPLSHLHYLSTCQSICLFVILCSEDRQTPFTKETCLTYTEHWGKAAHWSAMLLLFKMFLIITPVAEIIDFQGFYQSCLADSHQTDSSITQPLHLSLILIRNPFKCQVYIFFQNKAQREEIKNRTNTTERRK